jgi:hypothetical protein
MLQLKFFELKIILVIILRKKIVYYSFYFNLKIFRGFCFCRNLYMQTYISKQHTQTHVHKGKVHPRTNHEGPEGQDRYSATLSLTLTLDGAGGQHHAPTTLPTGKTRYQLYRRLGGPRGRSGRVRKIFPHRDSIPRPSIT